MIGLLIVVKTIGYGKEVKTIKNPQLSGFFIVLYWNLYLIGIGSV